MIAHRRSAMREGRDCFSTICRNSYSRNVNVQMTNDIMKPVMKRAADSLLSGDRRGIYSCTHLALVFAVKLRL